MRKFKDYDSVRVIADGRIGAVMPSEGKKVGYAVEFYEKSLLHPETGTFQAKELEAYEAVKVTAEELRQMVRGEAGRREVSEGTFLLDASALKEGEYQITAADLAAGLARMMDFQDLEQLLEWLSVFVEFGPHMSFGTHPIPEETGKICEEDLLDLACDMLDHLEFLTAAESIQEEEAKEELRTLAKYLEDWTGSDGAVIPAVLKRRFLDRYDDDNIDDQPEEIQDLFKEYMEELCRANDPDALQKRAYCYYSGCRVYPNDWDRSRDDLLKFYELTGDASAANSLGYIYYYGRCNGGIPEYDKAFHFFSIGHCYSYYESTYKLADMFANGFGVVRDPVTAYHLYADVYEQNLRRFVKGELEGKFADAAMRMGNCYRDGIGVDQDPEQACTYYLEADLALKLRRHFHYYGDESVSMRLQKILKDMEPYMGRETLLQLTFPAIFRHALLDHRTAKLTVRRNKDNSCTLTVSVVKRSDEENAPMMLVALPFSHYCSLHKKIEMTASRDCRVSIPDDRKEILFDDMKFVKTGKKTVFYRDGKKVGEISADGYFFQAD